MPVLTVVGITAHSPRGTEFIATARPPLSWRVQTTVAPWTQNRAELELRRGMGVETAVLGDDSVRVAWPFDRCHQARTSAFGFGSAGPENSQRLERATPNQGRLPGARRLGGHPHRARRTV
jgi:hypothetical protein